MYIKGVTGSPDSINKYYSNKGVRLYREKQGKMEMNIFICALCSLASALVSANLSKKHLLC